MTECVRKALEEFRRLCGSPKLTRQLNHQGIIISERTVGRIMKKQGLRSRTVKKYKATTNSNHMLLV
ncbi:transposase [Paenibacillus sp. sgz500958]|uniref:transposase n=1 Tax=Paenibacillus sp. sgz500958 TaxID=3242475 RepID=UPI0036D2491B